MASVASNPSHVTAQGVYSTGPTLAGDVDLLSVDEENLMSSWMHTLHWRPTTWHKRSHSTSACSSSSSSCPTATSASTSSSHESSDMASLAFVSLCDDLVPVVSVGHLSEETDFEALACELDSLAAQASPVGTSRATCTNSSGRYRPAESQLRVVEPQELRRTNRVAHGGNAASTVGDLTRGVAVGEVFKALPVSSRTSPRPKIRPPELSGASQSVQDCASSSQVAVLVDTITGRHRRLTRPRLTLAQTLLQLQHDGESSPDATGTISSTTSLQQHIPEKDNPSTRQSTGIRDCLEAPGTSGRSQKEVANAIDLYHCRAAVSNIETYETDVSPRSSYRPTLHSIRRLESEACAGRASFVKVRFEDDVLDLHAGAADPPGGCTDAVGCGQSSKSGK